MKCAEILKQFNYEGRYKFKILWVFCVALKMLESALKPWMRILRTFSIKCKENWKIRGQTWSFNIWGHLSFEDVIRELLALKMFASRLKLSWILYSSTLLINKLILKWLVWNINEGRFDLRCSVGNNKESSLKHTKMLRKCYLNPHKHFEYCECSYKYL